MYLEHFGLKELPFTITPDTGFFMNRAGYQDALNVLLVALRSGEGFVKVTGEVGVGKTLLCRKLLKSLGDRFVTAYIHNPYLQPAMLLFAIADELGVEYPQDINQHALQKLITRRLLEIHAGGQGVVLCLDEVQAMPVQTLECLRLLTNIETEKRKLIQVVLFGQPELDALLEHPSVRQLRQRITFTYRLIPLNPAATRAYVRHRLAIAGYTGPDLFARDAISALHRASGGIPRLINVLAHKALLAAFGAADGTVRRRHVRMAAQDSEEAGSARFPRFFFPGSAVRWLSGVVGALAIVVLVLSLNG
jgi:MSHA biogenesis protein MshM